MKPKRKICLFSSIVQKMLCNVSDALEDWEDEIDENYWRILEFIVALST